MGKVSYSQLSMWTQCPHKWKLNYIDELGVFTDNIYTLFGTSVHETIQAYLVCYYERTIKEADSLPMYDILQYRMETNYKRAVENSTEELDITLEDMKSFYMDGCNIIDEFIKHKSGYFPKKNTELVGIEIGLNEKLENNISFRGYMDVVIHNKATGRIKIIDIKTSTMGWNKWAKADKNKTNQLLLYKYFFSREKKIPIDKIDIEYLILKRKLYENFDYPQKRLQSFSPASGKPSINKVINNLNEFLSDGFDEEGNYINKNYRKIVSQKNCKWCEFKNLPQHCDRKM
mgnify:FL=1|jgi:hypothetical protein